MGSGIPVLAAALDHLRDWANARDDGFGRRLAAALDIPRHEARTIALFGLFLIGAAWLFIGIFEDVVSGDPLVLVDSAIFRALQDLRTAPADAVMIAITELGDTTVVIAVTAAVLLWLLARRAWRTAAYWLVAIAGASALNTVIKVALHRPRPNDTLYSGWSAFSFPSGHSTVNLVLYGFLAFLVAYYSRPRWRLPVVFASASMISLIAFSRLYLGAHWFSDVAGGLAFGTAWLALLGFTYTRRPAERVNPAGLFAVASIALIGMGGFHGYQRHAADLGRYSVASRQPGAAGGKLVEFRLAATAFQAHRPDRRDRGAGDFPVGGQPAGAGKGAFGSRLEPGRAVDLPECAEMADAGCASRGPAGDARIFIRGASGHDACPAFAGRTRQFAACPEDLAVRPEHCERADRAILDRDGRTRSVSAAISACHALPDPARFQRAAPAAGRGVGGEKTVIRAREEESPGWDGKVLLGSEGGR